MTTAPNHKTGTFYGVLALISLTIITTLCFVPILLLGLLKLFPNRQWQGYCAVGIDYMVMVWTGMTVAYVERFCPIRWHINGATQFNPKQWYLVISNHQSWLDIVMLQHYFHRKIPVLKFFVKEQLKWVPLFGFAWWAMGCPFMKRYSKAYLQKHPHKKGQDIQATHRALKAFKNHPSTMMSFIEGTRYTREKQLRQHSPYHHLLQPKAGGISQVISAMGTQLQPIVDVTLYYPHASPSLWDFMCRRIHTVSLNIRLISVPEIFTSSMISLEDTYTQKIFRAWLNEQWAEKDALISTLKMQTTTEGT